MRIRPAGSGGAASCTAFVRATASPRAALLFCGEFAPPSDWSATSGPSAADAQLGHAVGWVCEVRRDHVAVINPLGEGLIGHAWREAAWRTSGTWNDFTDWLRTGR